MVPSRGATGHSSLTIERIRLAVSGQATGASVVASDLTPELFDPDVPRRHNGVPAWTRCRLTRTRYRSPTASSTRCCPASGSCSAPHHQAGADELVRVCRPGGTIGLLSWTPEGFIGQKFATMKRTPHRPTRGAAPAAVGQRGPPPRSARTPCHRHRGAPADTDHRPLRRASGVVPRRSTGRPSPSIAPSQRTPTGSPPWSTSSRSSPSATPPAPGQRSLTGSTCSSPVASADDEAQDTRPDQTPMNRPVEPW